MSGIADLYSVLDVDRKEIRVLRLLPGWPGSSIKFRLRTVSLVSDPLPVYEALSYTWGARSKGKSITVHGNRAQREVAVTDNLFAALDGLRHRIAKSRTLWIDALCIDQTDVEERSAQVSMMSLIYRTAYRVNIWLDVPTASLQSFAVRTLAVLLNWPKHEPRPWETGLGARTRKRIDRLRLAYWLIKQTPQKVEEALQSSEPCWTDRMWVIQEYVLSRDTYLYYGRSHIHYTEHDFTLLHQGSRDYMPSRDLPALTNLRHNLLMFRPPQSLVEAAEMTADAGASDPRDKVYGLLGILSNSESQYIVPDYTLSTWRVYVQATFASMQGPGGLVILALGPVNEHHDTTLPTWVVDFSRVSTDYHHVQLQDEDHSNTVGPMGMGNRVTRHEGVVELYNLMRGLASVRWPGCEVVGDSAALMSNDMRDLHVRGIMFATVMSSHDLSHIRAPTISLGVESVPLAHSFCERIVSWSHNGPSVEGLLDRHTDALDDWLDSVSNIKAWFRHWDDCISLRHMPPMAGLVRDESIDDADLLWLIRQFQHYATTRGIMQCFATTNGFLGITSATLLVGDTVALIKGSTFPVILRRSGDKWALVGICFIHGIENDELLKVWDGVELAEEEFVLC
ncbi:hypothetical protein LTR53_003568 [Teratosphaeriaceae sp. CCFEE 6253]|nr:hypothetical protein LTR53_003568 [Teratosphaeriaceae sp. CCFEE 6253]